MNKLDKQLIEMVLKNHTYFQYGALMHVNDLDFAIDFVSQIKQSILKAIMKGKPKKDRTMMFVDEAKRLRGIGYNKAIKEFESVIKEILK